MNLFRLQLKFALRNRVILFWIMVFPIALSTFLKLAVANAYSIDSFDTINMAIIDGDDYPEGFITALQEMKFSENKKIFNITTTDLDNAADLLTDDEISGYITIKDSEIILTIKSSGTNATIMKAVLDRYIQANSTITRIMIASGGTLDPAELASQIASQKDYMQELDRGLADVDLVAIFFYAIIGMAVLYGGFLGTNEIYTIQANLSPTGARVSVSPVKRYKLLAIKMGTANLVHFFGILLLIAYLKFVLGITLASQISLVILIALAASITGVWLGAFISIALKRASIGVKIAITSITGVVGGMLAGMMSPEIKYWVNDTIPFLNYINPANLINDGLYSLYYYPTTERYFLNLFILIGISALLIIGTLLMFRRDSYESI